MRVDELLRAGGAAGMTLVAGPWDARPVEEVMIVDDLEDLDRAPRGCLAILTRHASSHAAGYELDIVLRRAGDRELAAVALFGSATTSVTAIRLADRSRVALLAVAPGRDLSRLAFELETTLRSGSDAMLRRILATLATVRGASEAPLGSLVDAASAALEVTVRYAESPDGAVAIPVIAGGRTEGWICADASDAATEVGCQLVADTVARLRLALRRSRSAAARARSEAIADMLRAPDEQVDAAAERARLLGIAVSDGHGVVALSPAEEVASAAGRTRATEALAGRVASILDELDPSCDVTVLDDAAFVVRTVRTAKAEDEVPPLIMLARSLLDRLVGGRRSVALICGVSSEHEGAEGLRTAVAEARAALAAARGERRINLPLSFDTSPLRRLLAEITAMPSARASIDSLLAPLEDLGPDRARTAIATLRVYLDERGSLTAAGRRLHLHPNAVAYRIKQIRALLEVDLDDPDQRLVLQVACRARLGDGADFG